MAEFAYNNTKNMSTGYILFELNCGYHSWMLYKKDFNLYFQSKSADKLLAELRKLMFVHCKKLYHTQKPQKRPTIKVLSLEAIPLIKKFG